MLKDADPKYFSGIYIVCGYTDLRYGIDSENCSLYFQAYLLQRNGKDRYESKDITVLNGTFRD